MILLSFRKGAYMHLRHPLILGSTSPRRKELLQLLDVPFLVHGIDIDESITVEDPKKLVCALSEQKARASAQSFAHEGYYIGADTVVYANKRILGKPQDEVMALNMLQLLQNNTHEVITGICVYDSEENNAYCHQTTTQVTVCEMSMEEMQSYIQSGDPFDKAGGYGIQGSFSKFVSEIRGCYFNVMGLPIHDLYVLIKKHCIKTL